MVAERREHPDLSSSANVVDGHWEVAYFSGGDELALVLVDPRSAEVEESWTGYQVAWKMARGYSGAFGHKLNAPYVFLPLCAIFLIGLVDWRHRRRVANLDLLVLIGFGVSNFFFNRAEIGVSVPIVYPLLLYLFGRALWIGIRGRGKGVRPVWPATWLLIAALFLVGFRVGLNVADSGAIDVGYASVVGADRIAHGEQLYDNFPEDVSQGDTYGPVNYYAYVPSERIWPWSGSWDDLPAAHGAAVLFDLATFALLFLLGRRLRAGPAGYSLGATLAFGWAAFPYTAYVLESNSNDALVSLFLVATLLVLARPMLRGAMASLAVFTKFAPVLLVPMLATYSPSAGGADDRGGRGQLGPQRPLIIRDRTRGSALRPGVHRCLGGGDGVARDQPRPAHVLREDDRLPGRPRLPVQHLGPGRPRAPAHHDPRDRRSPLNRLRLLATSQDPHPASRSGSRPADRPADNRRALVLPLHSLVLPPASGRDGDAGRGGRGASSTGGYSEQSN